MFNPNYGKHLCKSGNLRVSIFFNCSPHFLNVAAQIINYDIISNYRSTKVIYWNGRTQKKLDSSFQN